MSAVGREQTPPEHGTSGQAKRTKNEK